MKLHTLNCHNCGGLLKVPDHARYVTCSYCDSQLAIRESEGVRFTEQIHQRLDQLTDKNELRLLDLEWAAEQATLKISGENGGGSIPTRLEAWLIGGFLVVMGIILMVTTVPGVGIAPLFIGIGLGGYTYSKALDYEEAHNRYLKRREEMLNKQRPSSAVA